MGNLKTGKAVLLSLILVLAIIVMVNFAAAKFTEDISKDYTSNFEKWTYRESLNKKHPTFTLTHEWKSPAYKSSLDTDNDNLARRNSIGSFIADNQNSQNYYDYYALRDAFNTFNRNRYRSYSGYQGYIRNWW